MFRDREPLREDDLVIHIRAGDVFRKEQVHPKYGQPPLAYYLTVLRQRRWRSVHWCTRTTHNPVIEPLLDHLRAEGIEPTTVVTDLTSTIEFLLTAKTIVAGRGTFIPTIAGLSSNYSTGRPPMAELQSRTGDRTSRSSRRSTTAPHARWGGSRRHPPAAEAAAPHRGSGDDRRGDRRSGVDGSFATRQLATVRR